MDEDLANLEVAEGGQRLDRIVVKHLGLGRAAARRLIAAGGLRCEASGARLKLRKGDLVPVGTIICFLVSAADLDARARPDPSISLSVVYETEQLAIIDKPAGMPSAPLQPAEIGTAASGLLARYPEMADIGMSPREPGLCHRLDNNTSGLLAAARSQSGFKAFRSALESGQLDKRYLAVCAGKLADEGTIALAMGPSKVARRVAVGKDAGPGAAIVKTHFKVLRRGAFMLVEVCISRAYRHQVRAHLAAIGAPLVGDVIYGGPSLPGLDRHALHASRLAFAGGGGVAGFEVDLGLPADLARLLL